MNNDKHYKDALSSVLAGYSVSRFKSSNVYIKHFGVMDSIESQYQYDIAFNNAKSRGIPTESEQLEFLNKEDLWKKEDEELLKKYISELENSVKIRARQHIPSLVDKINKEIEEKEKKLKELRNKRIRLVGTTAESLAAKCSEDFYIYNSLFFDKDLTKSFFEDCFEEVDAELLEQSKIVYYNALRYIMGKNIKKVALLREFMDLMHLAQDHYQIIGKPYCQYTYFQQDLIFFGRYYKVILSQDPQPPQGLLNDPDKLEQWFDASQNAKKILQNQNKDSIGDTSSVMVGATQEDLKKVFGDDPNIVNLDTEIKKAATKKGGILNMQDMMKLHGIKV